MGQYYRACVLKKNWKDSVEPVEFALSSYDFENGAKLMEHSYCGNEFMNAAMLVLSGKYYGYPFVWCGDYADPVVCAGKEVEIYEDSCRIIDGKENYLTDTLVNDEFNENRLCGRNVCKYIVNLSKGVYVKLQDYERDAMRVHPLSLLCSSGNGRGGGDYGIEDSRVGSWAYDEIGCTNDESLLSGLKEVDGFFEYDR